MSSSPTPVRTTNLPRVPSAVPTEVLAHADIGGGAQGIVPIAVEYFIQFLLGRAGLDPGVVLELTQQLAAEISDREAGDAALRQIQDFQAGNVDTEVQGALPPARWNFSPTTGLAVLMDPSVTLLSPWIGQSNTEGGQLTGPDPISTTALYPGRVLMPATGARFFDAYKEGSAALLDFGYFDELVSARETREASGLSESPVSGFGNHFYKLMEDAFPGAPKCRVASFVSARGGTQLKGLKEGSAAYRQLLRGVQLSTDAEARKGRRVIVPTLNMVHGEAETRNPGYNASMLDLFQRTASAAIKAITGQTQEVILLLSQTNTVNPGVPAPYQRVQLEQLLAARRNPFIRIAGPIYPMPMEKSSNAASSSVHKSSVGINRIGMMHARAAFDEICGMGRIPFAPKRIFLIEPTFLHIDFDVPGGGGLVMDASGGTVSTNGIPGYFGLEFLKRGYPPAAVDNDYANKTIQIVEHTFFSSTSLRLRLAEPATDGGWFTGGLRRNNAAESTGDGPETGARTCLRNDVPHVSLMDGASNFDWSLAFCEAVNPY